MSSQEAVEGGQAGDGGDAQAEQGSNTPRKIEILLKPVGDAPIMKQKKFLLEEDKTTAWVSAWVKRYLKISPGESLFLYINQAFAPHPDSVMRNLYHCFGSEGKLVLHYSITQAWG